MANAVSVVGMLLTGTINTESKSLANEQHSTNLNGQLKPFHYPWTQTLLMFMGEFACLGYLYGSRWVVKRRSRKLLHLQDEDRQLLNIPAAKPTWFLLTCLLDLCGTTLSGIGLIYTTASVYQMLRGSLIVFSALLRVIFRKKKLHPQDWFGLFIVVTALFLVGLSSQLDGGSSGVSSVRLLFGNVLVVLGMLFNAIQYVIEEVYVQARNYHALQVVGMEGMFGTLIMLIVVLPLLSWAIPGTDEGHAEYSPSAFFMMGHNPLLMSMCILYVFSIAFYNFFGLKVTKRLSTVHRTLLDALRIILVWSVDLTLFYASGGRFGEPWASHSWLELIGFLFLFLGSLLYYHVLNIPVRWCAPRAVPSEEERLIKDET